MKFILDKDTLTIEENKFYNSGSVDYYEAEIQFDETWNDLTIEAIITKMGENKGISRSPINNKLMLDIQEFGTYTIGFVGYKIENEEKIYQISTDLGVIQYNQGAGEIETENEPIPTVTEWEIYIAQIQDMIDNIEDMDITAEKIGKQTTITITKKDGTIQEVVINDGQDGQDGKDGDDYIITQQDYEEIANIVKEEIDIPTTLAELSEDSTHRTVTDTEKGTWNNKAEISDIPDVSNFITKNVNNLTNYTLKTNTGSLIDLEINQTTYVVTLSLKDQDGNVISTDTIDLPLENVVVSGSYDSTNQKIVLTLQSGDTVDIPVGALVSGLQSEITSQNKLASDLIDDSNSGNKFVTTSEKQAWNNKLDSEDLTDYVKNTDYATGQTGGVIKAGGYGVSVDANGRLYSAVLDYATYLNQGNVYFIGKGTLENVITGKALETANNKVISISSSSTDTQYPSAKAVYDSQEEQNIEIEKLQTENTRLKATLPTTTGEGQNITLNKTAELEFIKPPLPMGNSEQATRSGKNYFDASKIANSSIVVSDNGKTITMPIASSGNGNTNTSTKLSSLCPNLKVGDIIYLRFARNQNPNRNHFVYLYGSNITMYAYEDSPSYTISQADLNSYVFLYGNDYDYGETQQVILTDFRIVKNSTDEWEQFGASPSPDYPSEIHSVADDVNLFDKEKTSINSGATKTALDTGIRITLSSSGTYKSCGIEIGGTELLGKTITLYSKITPSSNNNGAVFIYYGNSSNMAVSNAYANITNTGSLTKTLVSEFPTNCDRVYALFYGNRDGTGNNDDYVDYTNLKIQYGDTATPYSPYNQGTVTIKQENIKNYLDWDKFIDYSNWSNSDSPGYKCFEISGLKHYANYTLCRKDNFGYGEEYKYAGFSKYKNNSGMFIHSTDESRNLQSISDTSGEDGTMYINLYGVNSQNDLDQYISIIKKCWVIEGTEYQEYVNNNYTIQTAPLRSLPNGVKDTIEADGIHRRVGRIVLNGTENWDNYSLVYGSTEIVQCRLMLSSNYKSRVGLSDRFLVIADYSATEHIVIGGGLLNAVFIHINKSRLSTEDITGFKNWLSNNNIELLYELATEVIEPFTEEQQEVYNEIKQALSYEEQTNISSNQNAFFSVEAYQDTKIVLNEKYTKPSTGIPKSDLASSVQTSLGKADTAIQSHQDISGKQDITDNTLTTINKTVPTAINEVNNIAKGANQAVSYASYQAMVTAVNSLDDDTYNVGQNIYIVTTEVPDLWISSVESTSSTYTYVDDATIVSALQTNGYIQVGYYKLAQLETQKVDLTDYATKTYVNNLFNSIVDRDEVSY